MDTELRGEPQVLLRRPWHAWWGRMGTYIPVPGKGICREIKREVGCAQQYVTAPFPLV